MRQPFRAAASKQMTATWGFSLMLATVRGEAMSANTTCSSSKMRIDPLAETFGFPVLFAEASNDGRISAMAFLASSVSFVIKTSSFSFP
jgi:hypothetical protein